VLRLYNLPLEYRPQEGRMRERRGLLRLCAHTALLVLRNGAAYMHVISELPQFPLHYCCYHQ